MAQDKAPLFLERGTYRRRRMMDAVKLVVVLGTGLWMMPVIWPVPEAEGAPSVSMSNALYYVFGVWLILIVISFLLSSRLRGPGTDFGAGGEDTGAEQ